MCRQQKNYHIIFPLWFILFSTFLITSTSYAETPDRGLTIQNSSYDFLSMNENFISNNVLEFLGNYIEDFQDNIIDYPISSEKNILLNKDSIKLEYPSKQNIYLVKEGMPKNTRHLKEGYWIGSLPNTENIISMKEHGIKIILTVTNTKKSWDPVKQKIQDLGIEHIIIPVGSRFPKDTSFYNTLLNYNPNEIFIHCDHGADRSGTFIAYLLARRNQWPIQKALLAMVNHNSVDIDGLKKILKQYGYTITEDDLSLVSVYSGPYGGIKVRNEDYRRLVSTMINTFQYCEK